MISQSQRNAKGGCSKAQAEAAAACAVLHEVPVDPASSAVTTLMAPMTPRNAKIHLQFPMLSPGTRAFSTVQAARLSRPSSLVSAAVASAPLPGFPRRCINSCIGLLPVQRPVLPRGPVLTAYRFLSRPSSVSLSASTSASTSTSSPATPDRPITMAPPQAALEFLDFVNSSPTRKLLSLLLTKSPC